VKPLQEQFIGEMHAISEEFRRALAEDKLAEEEIEATVKTLYPTRKNMTSWLSRKLRSINAIQEHLSLDNAGRSVSSNF